MPQEPTELSFWIATHLDADERLFVIRLNSPIQRLRWLLSLMNKVCTVPIKETFFEMWLK